MAKRDHVLELAAISCSHDGRTAVTGLDLAVTAGDLVCLLGSSGCGKTTVLRAIAGFHPLDEGTITLGGQIMSQPGYSLAPEQRQVGMVFQDHALFPHLNVTDNVAFGIGTLGRKQQQQIVEELLTRMGLVNERARFPHELSSGQQQRVALARALAPNPKLLLMDEPFSNLDIELRERLGYEVRDILKDRGTTAIMVTHDQFDSFALSDKVAVMNEGHIVQWDSPYNLYHEPASRFVADFIGEGVFLKGRLLSPDTVDTELGVIKGNRAYGWGTNAAIRVLVRPDDIVPDDSNQLLAKITRKAFKGAEIMYTLKLDGGTELLSLFPSHANHEIGEQVGIRLQADHLVAFLE